MKPNNTANLDSTDMFFFVYFLATPLLMYMYMYI
jgi:hypothetical protein